MEFRKIINFGNSSYVISLPKDWITTNKLNKGDAVALEKNGANQLLIFPKPADDKPKSVKVANINVNNKSIYEIKREIVSAYLDNNSSIAIVGDNISPMSESIRDIITDLAASEIMEQTSKKIVVRDFLDMNTIALPDLIRKIDLIIRAMLNDAKENLDYPSAGHKNIPSRDKDVNRLSFLASRMIRQFMRDPYFQKKVGLSSIEIFELYNIVQRQEAIGDAIKRLSRFTEKNIAKLQKNKQLKDSVKNLMELIYNFYVDGMKAYYKRDRMLASSIANRRLELTEAYDKCCAEHFSTPDMRPLIENFYVLISLSRGLLRICYQITAEN